MAQAITLITTPRPAGKLAGNRLEKNEPETQPTVRLRLGLARPSARRSKGQARSTRSAAYGQAQVLFSVLPSSIVKVFAPITTVAEPRLAQES